MKIALIAHDKKKSEIIELAKKYKDVLANYELYAYGNAYYGRNVFTYQKNEKRSAWWRPTNWCDACNGGG